MATTRIDTHENHECGGAILLHIETGAATCLVCDLCNAYVAVDSVVPAGQDVSKNKAAWAAGESRSPGPPTLPAA